MRTILYLKRRDDNFLYSFLFALVFHMPQANILNKMKILKSNLTNVQTQVKSISLINIHKGNNKITELRTILQRKVKTHKYINRQNQSTTGKL